MPKITSIRKTSFRRKAGASGQENVVNQRVRAGRKTSSRKGGGIDQSVTVNQIHRVDPDTSRRKTGAPGHEVIVTQTIDAGRKTSSRDGGGIDHDHPVNQTPGVDPDNSRRKAGAPGSNSRRLSTTVVLAGRKISSRKGGGASANQKLLVDPELIASIGSLHREHRGLQIAVGDMRRRIKAEERFTALQRVLAAGGEHKRTFPTPTAADIKKVAKLRARYYEAVRQTEELRKGCLEQLMFLVKQLPIAPWVETVPGFALPSLAAIIGEAGDLNNYACPARLWKRMSLHVTDEGVAARRIKGDNTSGFVPRRRAEMQVIGYVLEKQRVGTEYRDLYLSRKAYERAKLKTAGVKVVPAAKIPKAELKSGKYMAEGQVRNRALRFIEKRLLKNLWRAWTGLGKEYVLPLAA